MNCDALINYDGDKLFSNYSESTLCWFMWTEVNSKFSSSRYLEQISLPHREYILSTTFQRAEKAFWKQIEVHLIFHFSNESHARCIFMTH